MKVSVLIVCFNHSPYISQAIDGILSQQNCADFEIILCDDCSTDDTVDIARHRLEGIPNVTIVSNETNVGITRNYQKGFALCTGQYLFIVEGDDYWIDPLKIHHQTAFLDEHPEFAMCAHTYYTFREEIGTLESPAVPYSDMPFVFKNTDLILDYGIISNFTTGCYRNSMIRQIPMEVYEVVSYEWMINISIGCFGPLARLNRPMSVYRISALGVWSGRSALDQLQGIEQIIPVYDRVLHYRYREYFDKKLQMVRSDINTLAQVGKGGYLSRASRHLKNLLKPKI